MQCVVRTNLDNKGDISVQVESHYSWVATLRSIPTEKMRRFSSITVPRCTITHMNYTGMFPVGDTSCRTLIAVCVCVCPPTYS